MFDLSDVATAIHRYYLQNGRRPDRLHIPREDLRAMMRESGKSEREIELLTTDDPLHVTLYGLPVEFSDTLAVSGDVQRGKRQ